MWHASDAWSRREQQPNILLVHFDDLLCDLDGEMRRLSNRLGIEVDEAIFPELVRAATFTEMQAGAEQLAPDAEGVLKNRAAFFRRGTSGAGREVLTPDEFAHYEMRAAELAPPDVVAWLQHRASDTGLRDRLRTALTSSMKARDKPAIAAYRAALSAVDNAESADLSAAPPVEHGNFAGGVAGLGAGEVPRRSLTRSEHAAVLRTELARWSSTANDLDRVGRTDDAERLRAEIRILEAFLAQ
jgi:uncharacterized protein YqeY